MENKKLKLNFVVKKHTCGFCMLRIFWEIIIKILPFFGYIHVMEIASPTTPRVINIKETVMQDTGI